MSELTKKRCIPCEAGTPPLTEEEVAKLKPQVAGWEVLDNKKIHKRWKFKNFAQSLEFVNKVGQIAEQEGHHPDISFGWGYAEITLTTHAIKGLSENDFILAAKIDELTK